MIFTNKRRRVIGVVFLALFLVLTMAVNLFLESSTVLASDLEVKLEGTGNHNYRIEVSNPVAKLFDIEKAQPGESYGAEIVIVNHANTRISLSMLIETATPNPPQPDLSTRGRLSVNNAGLSLFNDVLHNVTPSSISSSFMTLSPSQTTTLEFRLDLPGDEITNEYQKTRLDFKVILICNFLDMPEDPYNPPPGGPIPGPPTARPTTTPVTDSYQPPSEPVDVVVPPEDPAGQPTVPPDDPGVIIEIIPEDRPGGAIKVNPSTWRAVTYSVNFTAILLIVLAIAYIILDRENITRHLSKNKSNSDTKSE